MAQHRLVVVVGLEAAVRLTQERLVTLVALAAGVLLKQGQVGQHQPLHLDKAIMAGQVLRLGAQPVAVAVLEPQVQTPLELRVVLAVLATQVLFLV